MAITVRNGYESQFDINKMLPGEFAVTTDTNKVYICTAPGISKELASVEELQNILGVSDEAFEAFQELINAMEDGAVVTGLLNDVNNLKSGNYTISFSEAEEINNIESTDTIKVILGKIKKFFSSLSDVAFSGNYNDISDTPDLSDVALTGKSVDVTYDNSNSGLKAKDVQGAIDEVSEKTVKNSSDISVLNTKKTLSIALSSQSNFTINSLTAFKINGVLDLHVSVKCDVANTSGWVTIGTLPEDGCPATNIYKDVPHFNISSGNNHIRLRVTTAGLVQLALGTAGASYALHDVFIV